MITKIVEVTNRNLNWGKFLLGWFDHEWEYQSKIDQRKLLQGRGWDLSRHLMVFDLETGEGAMFSPGGYAKADLDRHRIWVCPMFEPFLNYLYEWVAAGKNPATIPNLIDLEDAPFAMYGYRRPGPDDSIIDDLKTAIAGQCSCSYAGCLHDKMRTTMRDYKP